jgi:hypothetical protein
MGGQGARPKLRGEKGEGGLPPLSLSSPKCHACAWAVSRVGFVSQSRSETAPASLQTLPVQRYLRPTISGAYGSHPLQSEGMRKTEAILLITNFLRARV